MVQGDHFEGDTQLYLMIETENLTFQGHPGHPSNPADPGDRARDHDPRHSLRLQLSLQAAGSGEGDEQGIQSLYNTTVLHTTVYTHYAYFYIFQIFEAQ